MISDMFRGVVRCSDFFVQPSHCCRIVFLFFFFRYSMNVNDYLDLFGNDKQRAVKKNIASVNK